MKVLGVPQRHYAVDRNILTSTPSWMTVRRPHDLPRLAAGLASRMRISLPSDYLFRFTEPFFPSVDLLHTFNAVCQTTVPWVCTFESSLPRYRHSRVRSTYRRGLDLLLLPQCRSLIAFSAATRNLASLDWERHFSLDEHDRVLAKTTVLHPPQHVLTASHEKPNRDKPHFLFLGRDFYRKGGLETLEALHNVYLRKRRDWHATIVGNLDSFGDYATQSGPESRVRAEWLLQAMSGNVKHLARLTSAAASDAMRCAHFHVLPTLADTYGYSVLEAQAHAAVCITTNVRALPEINSNEVGFRIDLPLDEARNAHTLTGFAATRRELVCALTDVLWECVAMPEQAVRQKADMATARLQAQHCPDRHQEQLDSIYRYALTDPETAPAYTLDSGSCRTGTPFS